MTKKRLSFHIPLVYCPAASLLFLLHFSSLSSSAQKADWQKKENRAHHRKLTQRHSQDSIWQKELKITDTAAARFIEKIQDINSTLNDFNDVMNDGYDSTELTEALPGYELRIKFLQTNFLNTNNNNLNLSRISYIQGMLDDMSEDLKDWQKSLLSYYTVLVGINTQMRSMLADSSITDLPTDSTLRLLYLRQFNELKKRIHGADTVMKKNLLRIDLLQTKVTDDYFDAVALQKQINTLVKDYRKKAFTKESEYLWEGISHDSLHRSLRSIISESYTRNKKVFISYITQSWNKYILLLPVFLFFFFWPLLNIQKIRKRNQEFMENLLYIRRMPLLSALAIILLLAPYLDLQHPPAVFNIFIQFLLLLVISMILFRKWPGGLFRYWIFFLLAFLFFAGKSLLSGSTYYLRVFTFVITIFYAGLGIRFIRETRTQNKYFPQFFPAIIGLFILLNLSASGCNLLGRATFAHILETTAILNFLEAMSLIICIQLLLDAVNLQLEADKKSSRFTAYLNYQNVALRLRRLLTVTAGIFWFINLAQNLNVFDSAYDAIAGFLESERSVGNTSFTIGSIVIFFFVIWVANFFQKYIGYFFGDTGADDLMPEKKSKIGTSILLVRLLILTSGFFLGILASGIPLDKVTIIIGALGVGIGLGLQNIVNNLVSGVILAVERPIQVGDLIEVGSSIGRVKEIGIRSCRIITEEGAEVIIPNGDVLSQKLTNWTLNNTHMRVDATLKLADSSQLEKAKEIIIKVLQSTKGVLQTPEPQILYKNISQAGAEMQILFWADDINRYVQLKSEILRNIYEECSKEGITIA